MVKLKINTPQNVNIEYGLASIGSRILAFGLDVGIMLSYGYLVSLILRQLDSDMDKWLMYGLSSFLYLPVFLYHFLFETLLKGQTLGKRAVKIKVIKLDGSRATIYEYFIRWTMNVVDIWVMGGIIGVLSGIISKKTQRLGDVAAGTAVINLKPQLKLIETVYENISATYSVVYPQVARLSDKDINLVKAKFQAARKEENNKIIHALANRLKKVLELSTVTTSDHVFIKRVLQDHYHYYREE